MDIGPLNTRCTIQQKTTTQEATYGTESVTWTVLATCWCSMQDVLPSRSERVKDSLEVSQSATRWRARYRTDVDSTMRIIVNRPDPTIYQIISGPAILGDRDGIECMIEKVSTVV